MDARGRTSQADHHAYYDWRNRFWHEGPGLWLLTHPQRIIVVVSLAAWVVAMALGASFTVALLMAIPAVIVGAREFGSPERAERLRREQLDLEAERIVEREEAIERARARRREQRTP